MGISGPQYWYHFKGTDTSKGFQATGNSRIKRVPILAISIGTGLSVPIRMQGVPVHLPRTDTTLATGIYPRHTVPIRLHPYRNRLFGIGTSLSVPIRNAFRTGTL
ncbi:hypothetical protein V6N12_005494 [Hibiscus sabdariffa]|uniref:Uncharacterized protein n=1 Tax=Hibiscus sabdariffa TaxID=183260 RepID=A0ABR2B723_9ROSI